MRHIDYSPDPADVENTAYLIKEGVISAQVDPHGHNTVELVFKNHAVVIEVVRIEHFDA
jgi:hypothetical protein